MVVASAVPGPIGIECLDESSPLQMRHRSSSDLKAAENFVPVARGPHESLSVGLFNH